jgi:threonine dehydratase
VPPPPAPQQPFAGPGAGQIAQAASVLAGQAVRTPVIRSAELDRRTGACVVLKAECLQRTGSFKFRGAFVAATRAREAGHRHLVAYSSGNHAAALSRAGRLLGQRVSVFMPYDAPASKVEAARSFGADVRHYDRYEQDRVAMASAYAAEHGGLLVPSADDPHVIAGQATATAELLAEHPDLDVVVVPVGGGGLMAGAVSAVLAAGSQAEVVAVEPVGSDDFVHSLASGQRESVTVGATLADGLQLATIGGLPWEVVRGRVRTAVTVEDDGLRSAVAFLVERVKLVVEPSGAAPVSALLTGTLDLRSARVGVVLSGGNVSPEKLRALLA